eukprot:CAMPEP_0168837678 /NCGR_PEP_ID=MMETSP0727-20121128/5253_1 /TAXON_ID=265536 /ORGANISM="Amphiprora sp., Strain CCMP467" /LENGTH=979 /DNA_ID=CAMNT_0008891113 /DNA_START=57 /DNA_END=2993 /DNA_ORIENTATION=-
MGNEEGAAIARRMGLRHAQGTTCLAEGLVFESPFNDGSNSGRKTDGFMFYLSAQERTVTVQALELDVLLDESTDLSVEVYVADEDYDDLFDTKYAQAGLWTKIADTQLIPHPDGQRSLIADKAFEDVTIGALSKKSFFVRMKGPWLDYTAYALTKGGEMASTNGQMTLFAGSPVEVDSTVDPDPDNSFAQHKLSRSISPILAGRVYYNLETTNCNGNGIATVAAQTVETSMEFAVLTDAVVTGQAYSDIEKDVNSLVESLLVQDQALKGFVTANELRMGRSADASFRVYSGQCPWDQCKTVIVELFMEHQNSLDPGIVKSEIYQNAEQIVAKISSHLPETASSLNVGRTGAETSFRLTLHGIPTFPSPQIMDDVQLAFLEDYLVEFLSLSLPATYAEAHHVQVESQKLVNGDSIGTLSSLTQLDAVQLTGNVKGAQFALETASQFASRIQSAFDASTTNFIPGLDFNLNIPGDISKQDRSKYFASLTHITTLGGSNPVVSSGDDSPVTPVDGSQQTPTTTSSNDGGGSSVILIGVVVSGVVLAVAAMIFLWCYRRRGAGAKDQGQATKSASSWPVHNLASKRNRAEISSTRTETLSPEESAQVGPKNQRGRSLDDSEDTVDTFGTIFSDNVDLENGRAACSSRSPGYVQQYPPKTNMLGAIPETPLWTREQPQPIQQQMDFRPQTTLHALRLKNSGQLIAIMQGFDIPFDPKDVTGKEDLVRIIVQSQKLNIVSPQPVMQRRGSQGSAGPSTMPRRGSYVPSTPQMVQMQGSQGSFDHRRMMQMRGSQGSFGPTMTPTQGSHGSIDLPRMQMRGSQGSVDPALVQRRGSLGPIDPAKMASTHELIGASAPQRVQPVSKPRKTKKAKKRSNTKTQKKTSKARVQVSVVPEVQQRRGSLVAATGWSRQPPSAPLSAPPPPQNAAVPNPLLQQRRGSLVAASGWSRQPPAPHLPLAPPQNPGVPNSLLQASRRRSLVAAEGW